MTWQSFSVMNVYVYWEQPGDRFSVKFNMRVNMLHNKCNFYVPWVTTITHIGNNLDQFWIAYERILLYKRFS